MTTVGAPGRCNGNGVTKEPGNSRKHLIQMFHCRMEDCSRAAKRSTNNQHVCKYIGRINDQSNWAGPFSLVIMTLDYRSRGTWFDPRSGHSTGIFSLQVYFSSYYNFFFSEKIRLGISDVSHDMSSLICSAKH